MVPVLLGVILLKAGLTIVPFAFHVNQSHGSVVRMVRLSHVGMMVPTVQSHTVCSGPCSWRALPAAQIVVRSEPARYVLTSRAPPSARFNLSAILLTV
jgi:hypothetical protein